MRAVPIVSLAAVLILASRSAWTQQSAGFHAQEHTLNSGGHPAGGIILASSGFRVTLDALGDGVAAPSLASASFRVDTGFPAAYPPSGEVLDLIFDDPVTLSWSPERSVGTYGVYRGSSATLPALTYGSCLLNGLTVETATDGVAPPPGAGWFYLVTARNRLWEEGTKGFRSSGSERANPDPCP